MMTDLDPEILTHRPPKNAVDPFRPYAFLVEPEPQASGTIEDVAVLFLTNRECPYRCLMCDLWKNTTDVSVPVGAITQQIDFGLQRLPPAKHLKLYNAGSFFDPQAISPSEYPGIIARARQFRSLIVENHPNLCHSRLDAFHDDLQQAAPEIRFEVALGLETCHPATLERLNKRMTLGDFEAACQRLRSRSISIRVFVLLRAPGMNEHDGLSWTQRSISYAFDQGVDVVSIIPVRVGNGILDRLQQLGQVDEPSLSSMESILQWGLKQRRGRVLLDLWDAPRFARSEPHAAERLARLKRMNLSQQLEPAVNTGPHPTKFDSASTSPAEP